MNDKELSTVVFGLRCLQTYVDTKDMVDLDLLHADQIQSLIDRLLADEAPTIVIIIEGGRVQNALSNAHVGVTVIDYERDGIPLEELTEVPQDDGSMSLAEVYDTNVVPLDDHWGGFMEWWEHFAP